MNVETLGVGDKFYYPSVKGIALMCEVIGLSEKDVMVQIDDRQFYLPKKSIVQHGIKIEAHKAKAYVSQRLEDPDNDIVYLRYVWNDTAVDRMYNKYCEMMGRVGHSIKVPSATREPVMPDLEDSPNSPEF